MSFVINRTISQGFIGTGVGILGAWNYTLGDRGVVYPILSAGPLPIPKPDEIRRILNQNFLLKTNDSQNYISWFGSAVSHQNLVHCAFNLITFSSFSRVLWSLPTRHFATLLAGGAVASSGTWLYEQGAFDPKPETKDSLFKFRRDGAQPKSALGSSGVVSAVFATTTMFAPRLRILAMGIVPLPIYLAFGGYIALDTYMMTSGTQSGIGHAAHIGGAGFGIAYYVLFLRRFGGILGPRRF